MKSLFEEMGGTYRQEGDYLIPNLALPDEPEYQIGKYGRMRRSYLKEHRPVLYASLLTSGTLHRHLAEIDLACNERMEIIVPAMAKQACIENRTMFFQIAAAHTPVLADLVFWLSLIHILRGKPPFASYLMLFLFLSPALPVRSSPLARLSSARPVA